MDELSDEMDANPRQRILAAAARLIATDGVGAATTRAVAVAAQVQAPTLYRLFGDKDGLLDAVAEQAMSNYVDAKAAMTQHADPVAALREGWDRHVAFGLENPGLFSVLITRQQESAAMRRGREVLRGKIQYLAQAGRLQVAETRALDLMQASATGVILTLLHQPADKRTMTLSDDAREAVLRVLVAGDLGPTEASDAVQTAVTLQSKLPQIEGFSAGERLLMAEFLERISGSSVNQEGSSTSDG